MLALTVVYPFGAYAAGQQITDPGEVAAVQAGEFSANVVQVNLPDAPGPGASPVPAGQKPAKQPAPDAA